MEKTAIEFTTDHGCLFGGHGGGFGKSILVKFMRDTNVAPRLMEPNSSLSVE